MVTIKCSLFNFIRDSVVEILFEQDNEEKSVATLILDSLLQVFIQFPIVLRVTSKNIFKCYLLHFSLSYIICKNKVIFQTLLLLISY